MPGKFAHPTSSFPKYLNLFSLEKPYSPFIYVLPLLPRVAVASMCSSGCSVQRASASQLAARARGTRHVMLGLHIIIFFLNLVRLLTSLTHLHALTSSSSPPPRQFRPRLYGSAHGMDSLRMVQCSCCGITWRGGWVTWQCWATFKTHRASGKYSLSSSFLSFPILSKHQPNTTPSQPSTFKQTFQQLTEGMRIEAENFKERVKVCGFKI